MKSRKRAAAFRHLATLALLAMIGGCATTGGKNTGADYAALYKQADAEVVAGRVDSALAGFSDASKSDPSRKEPWVRTAQLEFDKGNYARAIIAAQEVLQRDPTDLVADSVLTVSGFRIANQSLMRLKGNGALASDTARSEAETLVQTLRSTMGDDIVGSPPAKAAAPARRSSRSASRRKAAAPAAAESAPAPAASAPAQQPVSSDPFKNIGGN